MKVRHPVPSKVMGAFTASYIMNTSYGDVKLSFDDHLHGDLQICSL